MSQKYAIATFIEPVQPNLNFSRKEWPLHVTLLPNFVLNDPLEVLISNLEALSRTIAPFSIQVGEDAHFGPIGEVLVSLITPNENILSLHRKLLKFAKTYTFDTPQYIGEGYKPHATKQSNDRLTEGENYLIDTITLVDMFPGNNIERREVLRTFSFN